MSNIGEIKESVSSAVTRLTDGRTMAERAIGSNVSAQEITGHLTNHIGEMSAVVGKLFDMNAITATYLNSAGDSMRIADQHLALAGQDTDSAMLGAASSNAALALEIIEAPQVSAKSSTEAHFRRIHRMKELLGELAVETAALATELPIAEAYVNNASTLSRAAERAAIDYYHVIDGKPL